MIVDEDSVYLTTSNSGGVMQPCVTAFTHDGNVRWIWNGKSQRGFLKLRALHEAGYMVIETVPGRRISSRLALLDRSSGTEKRGIRMQGAVRILHNTPHPFAPDLLLMEEGETNSLISFSLDGKQPSFRYPSNQRRIFWPYPVVGSDFLAAPIITPDGRRLQLLTLRLKDRRGALPDGKKVFQLVSRIGGGGTRILSHPPYTICQTRSGIQILGTKELTPR